MQICPAQNQDLIKQKAMLFFNDGKVQEALQALEQIKDKETLAETDTNIWKKHCEEILEYKFQEVAAINDSLKIVVVKTSLLTHFGVYNSNTKRYSVIPVYDEIPLKGKNASRIVVYLNRQTAVLDLEGKTIIPLSNYAINVNIYNEYMILYSNDGNSLISIYSLDGKLLVNNLKSVLETSQEYLIIQNSSNKLGLFDVEKRQFLIDDCDKIENIDRSFNENANGFFIKKDNKTEVYNFKENSFTAQNAFDQIITYDKGLNILEQKQINKDNTIKNLIKDKLIIVKKNSKFGIYNLTQNKYDTEPIYDSINNFYNVLKNKVWRNLKYEYPIKEDSDYISNAVIYAKNNLFGLKTILNKTITEAQYDEVEQINNSLFFTKKQKLWGWISVESNKISIVKPQFDHVYLRYDSSYDFKQQDFDKNYKTFDVPYLETCFKSKIKKYTLDGKEYGNSESKSEKGLSKKEYPNTDWRYSAPNSNRILTSQTKFANADEEELTDKIVFGLDDKTGNEIVKPIYTRIVKGLENQFVVIQDDRNVGVIDENGKVIIPLAYNSVDFFDNKYYIVGQSYNFGVFDKEGKEVFPIIYKEIKVFLDGYYLVKDQDNIYKIIDAQSKVIFTLPRDCDTVYKFEKITNSTNEAFFYIHGYHNYLVKIENNICTQILEKYDILELYDNNIIQLRSHYLIGFYDLNSKKIIEPKFKEIQIAYSNAKKFFYGKTDLYFDTIIDENLNSIPSNDHISNVYNNIIIFEKNGKYGFFDKNNKKIKNIFQSIDISYPIYSSGRKFYKFNDTSKRQGVVDDNGKIIIKANVYDVIDPTPRKIVLSGKKHKKEKLEEILICIDKSDKTVDKIDFVSFYGNKIAGLSVPKKNYSFEFRKGMAVLNTSGEGIFFDLNENKILLKVNGDLFPDNDGGFTVMKKSSTQNPKIIVQKYSTKGNLITERSIQQNQNFRYLDNWNSYLIQKKENKYGIISVDEKIRIPFVYDTIIPSIDSVYIAKKDNKYGFIDNKNNVVLNFEYDKIETQYVQERRMMRNDVEITKETHDKRAPQKPLINFIVSKNNKLGILGPNLKNILPIEYDSFRKDRTLSSSIIAIKGENSMVYNTLGNFLFEVKCDSLVETEYNPKCYKIYENGKQGFLNEKGNLVFPLLYPKVEKIYFGNLFIVEKDSKKYLANSEGKLISASYDEINFTKFYGYLEVKTNNKFGLINKAGTVLIPVIYDGLVQYLNYKYMVVSLNGMQGIIDLEAAKNKMLPIKIPISYGAITQIVNKKYLIVSDFSKTGVIDLNNNKIVIPMLYDSVYYQENKNYFVCSNSEKISYVTVGNVVIKDEQ